MEDDRETEHRHFFSGSPYDGESVLMERQVRLDEMMYILQKSVLEPANQISNQENCCQCTLDKLNTIKEAVQKSLDNLKLRAQWTETDLKQHRWRRYPSAPAPEPTIKTEPQ